MSNQERLPQSKSGLTSCAPNDGSYGLAGTSPCRMQVCFSTTTTTLWAVIRLPRPACHIHVCTQTVSLLAAIGTQLVDPVHCILAAHCTCRGGVGSARGPGFCRQRGWSWCSHSPPPLCSPWSSPCRPWWSPHRTPHTPLSHHYRTPPATSLPEIQGTQLRSILTHTMRSITCWKPARSQKLASRGTGDLRKDGISS